jgi:hypothetical protein
MEFFFDGEAGKGERKRKERMKGKGETVKR